MRISDWSSDVCSSDLVDVDADDKNGADKATVKLGFTSPAAPTKAADWMTAEFAKKGLKVTRSGDTRSAEHTSELQSLMRISYAVFCLHTKTYTAHITPTSRNSTLQQNKKCEQAIQQLDLR